MIYTKCIVIRICTEIVVNINVLIRFNCKIHVKCGVSNTSKSEATLDNFSHLQFIRWYNREVEKENLVRRIRTDESKLEDSEKPKWHSYIMLFHLMRITKLSENVQKAKDGLCDCMPRCVYEYICI